MLHLARGLLEGCHRRRLGREVEAVEHLPSEGLSWGPARLLQQTSAPSIACGLGMLRGFIQLLLGGFCHMLPTAQCHPGALPLPFPEPRGQPQRLGAVPGCIPELLPAPALPAHGAWSSCLALEARTLLAAWC